MQLGTFLVEFIELRASQCDIAFSIHRYDFLCVFSHEEVLAEYDVVENATSTEDIADGLRFSCHVLDVYDLGCHIARSTATYE